MEQSKSKRVAQQLYRGISGATVAPHGSNDSSMPRSARGVSLESKRAVPTESQPSASSSSTSSSSAALAAPALSSDASGAAAVPATVSCYLRHCHAYQTAPCAAIIVVLRFRGTTLRPAVTSPRFGDMDLLPFCECLMDASVAPLLNHIASLDFFNCALTAHGVSMLAHALMSNTSIALLRLDNNAIGSYGAKQIELLFRTNTTITALSLSNCALGSRGGTFIATLLANPTHSLADIDLTNNILGNRAVSECRAALATQKARGARIIKCDLDGNQVVAEILNSVTHFLGLLLCLVGTVYLLDATRADPSQSEADRDRRYWSCLVYCLSLCTLYLSSTLYHSFFTLKATKRIFQIFDHAAIFLLIAGTYTPFLAILFPDREIWSVYLLAFLWMVCAFGIGLTAFFHGPSKQHILLALYLSMGWAILLCISDVIARLDPMGLRWLIIGGLCYTGGVPFFIKDGHMDHAVWHLFVLAGSICHWIGIYCYLIPVGLSSHATA